MNVGIFQSRGAGACGAVGCASVAGLEVDHSSRLVLHARRRPAPLRVSERGDALAATPQGAPRADNVHHTRQSVSSTK